MRIGLVGRILLGAVVPALVSILALSTMLTSVAALRSAETRASQSQAVVVAAVDLSRATARAALPPGVPQSSGAGVEEAAGVFLEAARRDAGRLAQAQELAAAARTVTSGDAAALATFEDGLDGFLDDEQRVVSTQQDDVVGATRRAVVAAVVGLFASLAALVALGLLVTRSVSLPVKRASEVAAEFAAGRLDTRLAQDGVGEVGALQRSLNGMAASLGDAREELAASRARVVAAGDRTRRQVERDLHDGLQQRLVALSLDLRALAADVPEEAAELRAGVDEISADLAEAIADLREVARGLHPSILSDAGLGAALRALARRSALPAELDVEVTGRFGEAVETTAYYVVSEALTNAAKHSGAEFVRISAHVAGDVLVVEVADDGTGGALVHADGTGLLGLQDRVSAADGTLVVESPTGLGTTVRALLPVGPTTG